MADQQEFCLRWNDFHSNFHVSLDSLRGDESFTDVTLSCSGKLLKAHKVILSACSAHFKEIFKMIAPQQHPVIVLPTVDLEVMQAILEFIYQGQVNVRQARLGAFLQVAETFSIQGLADEDGKKSAQKTPSRSRPPDAGPTAGPGPKRRRLEVPRQPSPAARAPEEPVNIDMSVKLEPSAMLDELDDILEPGGDRRLPPTPALDTADKVQSIITIGSEDSGSQANRDGLAAAAAAAAAAASAASAAAAAAAPAWSGPPARSAVREFFSGDGQDRLCQLCGHMVRLNRQLSTSGLWRHMRLKHPEAVREATAPPPPPLPWPADGALAAGGDGGAAAADTAAHWFFEPWPAASAVDSTAGERGNEG